MFGGARRWQSLLGRRGIETTHLGAHEPCPGDKHLKEFRRQRCTVGKITPEEPGRHLEVLGVRCLEDEHAPGRQGIQRRLQERQDPTRGQMFDNVEGRHRPRLAARLLAKPRQSIRACRLVAGGLQPRHLLRAGVAASPRQLVLVKKRKPLTSSGAHVQDGALRGARAGRPDIHHIGLQATLDRGLVAAEYVINARRIGIVRVWGLCDLRDGRRRDRMTTPGQFRRQNLDTALEIIKPALRPGLLKLLDFLQQKRLSPPYRQPVDHASYSATTG